MGCSGRSEVGDRHRSGTGDDVVELHLLSPDPWSMNMINEARRAIRVYVKETKGRAEEDARSNGNFSVPTEAFGWLTWLV